MAPSLLRERMTAGYASMSATWLRQASGSSDDAPRAPHSPLIKSTCGVPVSATTNTLHPNEIVCLIPPYPTCAAANRSAPPTPPAVSSQSQTSLLCFLELSLVSVISARSSPQLAHHMNLQ
ncbi:hypothetical protein DL93DRAFT_2231943 [Clavulina sp. PMI_390]|nr:hypothetical protein DL93DRAFT_2231943 [Clavulina sp. PMI_390]